MNVLDLNGKNLKQIDVPEQFEGEYNQDLIKRAVMAIQSNKRQPYGAKPRAGKRYSSKLSRRRRQYKGSYGHGMSRVPRKVMWRRGMQFGYVGAHAPGTVGGRRAHPPKAEKRWNKKININLKEDTDIRFSASDGGNVVYTSLINIFVNKTEKEPNPQLISKNDFLLSEDVVFDFEFEPVDEIASNQITGFAVSEFASEKIEAFVYDHNNKLTDIKADIIKDKEGKFSIKLPKERAIRSGEYTLRVELKINGKKYVQQKEFTWGVLAINTHKSIYLENEEAFIGIGVLDDFGAIICDADLNLKITDPFGIETVLKTSDDSIKISPECSSKEITAMPDYYSYYTVGGEGNYILNLTAITRNGVRNVQDNFSVQTDVDFDVERKGPTRIYPFKVQTMNITIKANRNYKGAIREYTPSSFDIVTQKNSPLVNFFASNKKNKIINK